MATSNRSPCLGLLGIVSSIAIFLPATLANNTLADRGLNDPVLQQKFRLYVASQTCHNLLANVSAPDDGGSYCPPVWDNILCWPSYVPAGKVVAQPCPSYVSKFKQEENATRRCTEDGTWEVHPNENYDGHYTDFAKCYDKRIPPVLMKHIPIITRISTIGYSISLATLVLAISILVFFKKLHCQRNTIHINLFMSFCLRAVISVTRNSVLVDGLALPSDVTYLEDGSVIFKPDGKHWECKLLNTLWLYALIANYFWIFVEGLYLHTLIFFAVFSQTKHFFKIYIIVGWVLPLIFILTWLLVRIVHYNELCWNIHSKGFYWIIEGPIILAICINFFFFLNIVRVLFTKIRDCNTRDPKRYKKLAKSTLVLIPMFGVYYIVFIILSQIDDPHVSLVHIYMELPINSFQGAVVAMLFCFFNGEVQAEILKKWDRHRLRNLSLTSGRSSRALSTGSFYIGRDRTSVCLGAISSHVTSPGDSEGNSLTGKVYADPNSLEDGTNGVRSAPMIENHQPLPRAPGAPKVSLRSHDSNLNWNLPSSQTSHHTESMGIVSHGQEGAGDRSLYKCGHGSQNHNGDIPEEEMVLMPVKNNTNSDSFSKPKRDCLSLVKGETIKEDENGQYRNISKQSKRNNQENVSKPQHLSNINQLPTLDDIDIIDESQPILN